MAAAAELCRALRYAMEEFPPSHAQPIQQESREPKREDVGKDCSWWIRMNQGVLGAAW